MNNRILLSSISNALGTLAPQFVGILFLGSSEFGIFSATYLIYALFVSVTFSFLCDAWAITETRTGAGNWGTYSSALVGLSTFAGISGMVVASATKPHLLIIAATSIAIALAVYRVGLRYYLVISSEWSRVLLSDVFSCAILVGAFLFARMTFEALEALVAAWAISGIFAAFVYRPPALHVISAAKWIIDKRRTIRPLAADAFVMNISSIGVPFILLPVLGLSAFGVYRAVANLSAPVRLIVAPLRPIMVRSPRRFISSRLSLFLLMAAAVTSLACFAALSWAARLALGSTVLGQLAENSAAVSVYLFGAFLVAFYSVLLRGMGSARSLLMMRLVHSLLGLLLPIVGFLALGLVGSVWGFALATLLGGVGWFLSSKFGANVSPQR